MKWKQQESAHPDDRRVSKRCEVAVMTRTRFSLDKFKECGVTILENVSLIAVRDCIQAICKDSSSAWEGCIVPERNKDEFCEGQRGPW